MELRFKCRENCVIYWLYYSSLFMKCFKYYKCLGYYEGNVYFEEGMKSILLKNWI